jgi:hypothetical protein
MWRRLVSRHPPPLRQPRQLVTVLPSSATVPFGSAVTAPMLMSI